MDVVADLMLVTVPLHQVWLIKRPANERRLVRLVFSTSILTLVASIALCVVSYGGFLTGPGGLIVWLMSCHVAVSYFTLLSVSWKLTISRMQEAVAIFTSNALVAICWIHHKFPSKDSNCSIDAGDVHITPHWSQHELPNIRTTPEANDGTNESEISFS